MSDLVVLLLLAYAAALLLLPRRWAALPLIAGACTIGYDQVVELGSLHFTAIRILIGVGLTRVIVRNERLDNGTNALDTLMLAWSAWMLVNTAFHSDPAAAFVHRLGLVYTASGCYLLMRLFCRSLDDVVDLCRMTAVLLVPLAAAMLYEKITLHNLFVTPLFGLAGPEIRDGNIRAQGPFAHSILAGTVGAVSLPLMASLWRQHRKTAVIGAVACAVIIFSSASSGPILSAAVALGALWLWHYRRYTRSFQWLFVVGYIALDLVMKDPAYYLMARIDIVGGSTGWHRARLIQSALEHLSEWWLVGTDLTRHWMSTGLALSEQHTDITNHYVQMGVWGGLPLMALFIATLARGFSLVGRTLRNAVDLPPASQFLVWALGAALFSHAVTCISISYFDQSAIFLYTLLAAAGAVPAEASLAVKQQPAFALHRVAAGTVLRGPTR